MACHQDGARNSWHAGAHERANLACTDCHKMHQARGDAVLTKASEPQVCMACHKQQRAEFLKPSSHPVHQGRMACSDCHSPHGSSAPAMLAKPTLNQTCTSCHAEKRGPVLWEHAPVAEDCALVPHTAWLGAHRAADQDAAAAVPAMPQPGRPPLGGAHFQQACPAAAPVAPLS